MALKPAAQEEIKTYLLELNTNVSVNPPLFAANDAPVVMIAPMKATSGFETDEMIYTTDELFAHKVFAMNRWARPPAQMLTTVISQSLGRSGLFKAVIENSTFSEADLTIFSELLCIRQVFHGNMQQQPESLKSHVELEIKITVVSNRNGNVLCQKDFFIQKTADRPDPYAGVKALSSAVESFSSDLLSFLIISLSR